MTRFTLDNPPDDADYRNPQPNSDPRYADTLKKSGSSTYRMEAVDILASRCQNEREMVEVVFLFAWDFGWSYKETLEAIADAGYAYFDPIKGAS